MNGSLSFFVGIGSLFGLSSDIAWMLAGVIVLLAAVIWFIARAQRRNACNK